MGEIIFALLFCGMFLAPFLFVALDIVFAVKKQERPIFELIAFFSGSIYMALAFWVWDLPGYQQPLNICASPRAHEPFSSEHMLSIVIFAFWGFFSYFILKFTRKNSRPWLRQSCWAVCMLAVGCALCGCSSCFAAPVLRGYAMENLILSLLYVCAAFRSFIWSMLFR